MRNLLLLLLTLVFTITSTCMPAQADTVPLLKNGVSQYVIVLNHDASGSEKYAAEELQTHFKMCTSVKLPIVVSQPENDQPMIVLGRGKIAKQLGVTPTDEELDEQGFVLRTVGSHIVIAGTASSGTLYGVRHFLEKQLGVRWYAPGVTKTPTYKDLSIEPIDQLVNSTFSPRSPHYSGTF